MNPTVEGLSLALEQYWFLVPVFCLPIYLCFVALGKGNTSVAWLFSLSAPGNVFLVDIVLGSLSVHPKNVITPYILIAIFWATVLPGVWVFPIVFLTQLTNLLQRNWRPMTLRLDLLALALAGLYLWSGVSIHLLENLR